MLFRRRKHAFSRILIVEDEPLVAFDNEHFLRDEGYVVVATVDTVADALAAIDSEQPQLVLTDIRLSDGGTGLDVARAARAKGIPVVFVTATCPIDAQALAFGCLAKPYTPRDLRDAVEVVAAKLAGQEPQRVPPGMSVF